MDLEKCPFCGANVKEENLQWHYRRVHPKRAAGLVGSPSPKVPMPSRRNSHRKVIFAIIIVVGLLVGVTAFVLRPGAPFQEEPPPTTSAPLIVETSPSTLSIAGPGILSFNVTVTPQGNLSSTVVLSVQNKPPGVRVIFQPETLSLSQNPGSSKATLVVDQAFATMSYQMRVVASVSSAVAQTTVEVQISAPVPSRHFFLLANSSGWNDTATGQRNPLIEVNKGETFTLTLVNVPGDIHHYISIYPAGTPWQQVAEFSPLAYARSELAPHEYPGSVTITFTSYLAGKLEYYCDTHPDAMHGVINVTG